MKPTRFVEVLAVVPLALALSLLLAPNSVVAAEKCTTKSKALAKDSEYTQQYTIDATDMPGHQIRILELHRTFSNATPNCEGLTAVEDWTWGYSDYTDGNGHAWGYLTTIYDNGDKMFGTWSGTSQALLEPQGEATRSFTGTSTITGGTGVYKGVRGTGRNSTLYDPDTGYNESEDVTEYWIE